MGGEEAVGAAEGTQAEVLTGDLKEQMCKLNSVLDSADIVNNAHFWRELMSTNQFICTEFSTSESGILSHSFKLCGLPALRYP